MVGLAAPEDPVGMVSAQPSPQGASKGPADIIQGTEPTLPLHLVPNAAPSNINPLNPPVASSNSTWVNHMKDPTAITLSPDQKPAEVGPPL